jgi:SAM-dependent methyltransferase
MNCVYFTGWASLFKTSSIADFVASVSSGMWNLCYNKNLAEVRIMSLRVTPEAIAWAYRLLLDREPENQQIVQEWLTKSSDLRELLQDFLSAPEFMLQHPNLRFPALTGLEPEMQIEMDLSPSALQVLFQHVQDTWEQLGEKDAHFSVVTSELFKRSKINDNIAAFYATGQHDVECLIQSLARNGIDHSSLHSCLEFGCGVGRNTRWLCEQFEKVIGYDISRAHLRIAKEYFSGEKILNAQFRHIERIQDIGSLPRVDLVYSVIVLQHNPPPIIQLIIREFIKKLNPGGIAVFQVPTYRSGYAFNLKDYLASDAQALKMEMHVLPQKRIFEIVRQEGGRVIEVIENVSTGVLPFREMSNTFIIQKKVGLLKNTLNSWRRP